MRNMHETDKTRGKAGTTMFRIAVLSLIAIAVSIFPDRTGTANQAMTISNFTTALRVPVVTTTVLTRNAIPTDHVTGGKQNLSHIECTVRMQKIDNEIAVLIRTSLNPGNHTFQDLTHLRNTLVILRDQIRADRTDLDKKTTAEIETFILRQTMGLRKIETAQQDLESLKAACMHRPNPALAQIPGRIQ